jgi:Cof subfamily protein (haloacid dehalogenase superfamily)
MPRRLFAFDLDGTLLTSEKQLSEANRRALREMHDGGAVVALASGRLGSSVMKVAEKLGFSPSLLTLNGAAVYIWEPGGYRQVYSVTLAQEYADQLVRYGAGKDFAVNFYSDDRLFTHRTERTARWIDVYYAQTGTEYRFVESLDELVGKQPHKIIFVGAADVLDKEEQRYRSLWNGSVYICRTWEYYLEFLDPQANKARGLAALAASCGIDPAGVVAFGDADNDIPMLREAGVSVAMSNATLGAKRAATLVSEWSNDEDGVAKEWERHKEAWA